MTTDQITDLQPGEKRIKITETKAGWNLYMRDRKGCRKIATFDRGPVSLLALEAATRAACDAALADAIEIDVTPEGYQWLCSVGLDVDQGVMLL